MAGREGHRIFIGGLGWNTSQRHLEDAFSRYGRILDCLVMTDRDTGRPRGFGFLTFADRRAMEDAIRDMHGREMDGRVISVNKAEPKLGAEDPNDGYGGDRRPSGRESYRGGDRLVDRPDECFQCGRLGHWARDCPSSGGGKYSSQSELGKAGLHGDRFTGDREYDHYYDRPHYDSRERVDSRVGYGTRDRFSNERYANPPVSDRYGADKYMDRHAHNGYGPDRDYERNGGPRGDDRYTSGGPARYDRGGYRERAHPYERPRRSSQR